VLFDSRKKFFLLMYWMGGNNETQTLSEGKMKKQRKRYDIVKTANCTVCGDLAAEHLHYGGIACYSCRAFFRRTVNSNRPILDCSVSQECKINKDTRKRCQWCRFEKCKMVGMKTSWVLTEDDKNKLAIRRDASPVPGINIGEPSSVPMNIKKEETSDRSISPSSNCAISVKQRHSSSPMSHNLSHSSNLHMIQNQDTNTPQPNHFKPNPPPSSSANSFLTANHEHDNGTYNNPFFSNQFCPFSQGSVPPETPELTQSPSFSRSDQSFPRSRLDCQQTMDKLEHGHSNEKLDNPHSNERLQSNQSSIFPLNINKMQVSVSGATDGLSFTIETHNNSTQLRVPSRSPRSSHETVPKDPVTESRNQKRHHQQSRTIFRCVSNDNGGETDSMTSGSPDPGMHMDFMSNGGGWSPRQQCWGEASVPNRQTLAPINLPTEQIKPQVWRLDLEAGGLNAQPNQPRTNSFTLQETLFVEQLAAIDERVRYQVPMDQDHVKSFLNTAVSGSPISQMTIMHAYQACIKRIVRFANSLQDFVELPPHDMQKLLVANTVSIINIRIVRWFHPSIDLKTQLNLCGGGGHDLFMEAVETGKVSEHGRWRVNYDDVFCSPWCCDSTFEDRYEILMKEMHTLNFDNTIMVLLSVMCLFDSTKVADLAKESTIVSHGQKFALLLKRYLLQQSGEEQCELAFPKYHETLVKLKEMAEILINKRLIC